MDEVGISYADIVAGSDETASERYDPDQGARIRIFDFTDKVASDFFMMFCRGRKDVYDLRYTNPKTRKNGYYTQCFNRWDRNCHIQKKDSVRCKDCELRAYKTVTLVITKSSRAFSFSASSIYAKTYISIESKISLKAVMVN